MLSTRRSEENSSQQKFISVTGAHGVGKTTLVHSVKKKFEESVSVSVIPEPAREISKNGFYVNDKITIAGVVEYLRFCLAEARKNQASLVLRDRSTLDLYVYTRELFPNKFSTSLEQLIIEQILIEKNRMQLYVYVPIEFPMEEDGLRPPDLSYQSHIDRVVLELIRQFELPFITVSGSLEKRVETMADAIMRVDNLP